jgi:hypothetical protein
MRRTFDAVCLSAFIGAWPAPSICAEFTDGDVLPDIGYIVFTRDAVGFVSRPPRLFGLRNLVFRFTYDRASRKLAEVDAERFQARFPESALKYDPRVATRGSELIGRAGNGVEYRSTLEYCGEGGEDDETKRAKLTVGNKTVRILAGNVCTSVSSLEIVGDQLWLGTLYRGEGGGYDKAEGIIVESPGGGRVIARIPLTGWVMQVRADPFSSEVWAVTEYGIYQIGRQFQILSAHLYYHDFDPLTGEPRLSFSGTAIPGNPISVVSRMLPAAERKAFYEVVAKIPKADLDRFTLYDFFMCCDFTRTTYPASLRPLLPFLVNASIQEKPGSRDKWRQAACRVGGPDATQYCKRSE